MSDNGCSHPGKRMWETEQQAKRGAVVINRIAAEGNISDDAAKEVADLLGTSVKAVRMMTEEQVIRALVGDNLS
jgi:hypothetical protein